MRLSLQERFFQNDATYTVLFGLLSVVLSKVQFHIPDIGESNLREIPLLICLFHLRKHLFVLVLGLFALLGSSAEIPYLATYVVHFLPLLLMAKVCRVYRQQPYSATTKGIIWMLVVVAYYLFLLIPLVAFTISMTKGNSEGFWTLYQTILPPIRFEVITSSLVTGLYLMQMETHNALELQNKNLELAVELRTKELTHANNELQSLNEELTVSNEGIKKLNENLEQMVNHRTEQINNQLNQLKKYAYLNSHELRAPLARILGLIELMKVETDVHQWNELLSYLHDSSTELDGVIREMNRLLGNEIKHT